jgi:hypothetical protein
MWSGLITVEKGTFDAFISQKGGSGPGHQADAGAEQKMFTWNQGY